MTPFDICRHLLTASVQEASLKQSGSGSYPASEYAVAIRHDGLVDGKYRSRFIRVGEITKQSELASTRQLVTAMERSGVLPEYAAEWARARVDIREQEFAEDSASTKVSGELEWDDRFDDFYGEIRDRYLESGSEAETAVKQSSMQKLSSYEIRHRTVEISSLADVADTVKLFRDHERGLRVTEKRSLAKAVREALQKVSRLPDPEVAARLPAEINAYAGDTQKTSSPYLIRARAQKIRQGFGSISVDRRDVVASAFDSLADVLADNVKLSGGLDLESVAQKLSELDEVCDLPGLPDAYQTLFYPLGEQPVLKLSADDDDPYIYQFGQIMIRRSDVEKLPLVPMKELERFLSESKVDALREDPVPTFESLPEGLKRIVAEFIEESIRTRQKHLSPYLT